jgi:MFS family permease
LLLPKPNSDPNSNPNPSFTFSPNPNPSLSFTPNPWQAIPAEILRGTTFAMFWAGSTYFVYNASPKGLTATMLSILNGVYGGLGQSVGALVGGAMSKKYGISKAFYICGGVDFVTLSLFVIYQLRLSLLKMTGENAKLTLSNQREREKNSKNRKNLKKDSTDSSYSSNARAFLEKRVEAITNIIFKPKEIKKKRG